jgi:hypothetical protein
MLFRGISMKKGEEIKRENSEEVEDRKEKGKNLG